MPLLSELKETFTTYNIDDISSMKSIYAIRMYEIFKQFKTFGKREVELDWLKERLQIEDIYSAFADLKRRVIDPALKEINVHSDLTVSYTLKKDRKKVKALNFTFYKKDRTFQENQEIELNVDNYLLSELKQFGISVKQADELFKLYSHEKIQQAIAITKYNIESKQIRKSVSGFLIKALKEGYSSYELIKLNENRIKQEKLLQIDEATKNLKERRKQYEQYIGQCVYQKITEFSTEEKEKNMGMFLKQASPLTVQHYTKHGLESKMVHSSFLKYMKEKFAADFQTEEQFHANK